MNGPFDGKVFQRTDELIEDAGAVASRLATRWGRWTTARAGRKPQGRDKQLVRGVRDSLARCGLARTEYSVAGGEVIHTPRVVSADAGPPGWAQIDLLPGQSAEDFTAHAPAIAQNLGVPQVWVVPLGPSRIRLELPTHPDGA
jgi:hypothetical protein